MHALLRDAQARDLQVHPAKTLRKERCTFSRGPRSCPRRRYNPGIGSSSALQLTHLAAARDERH